MIATSGVNSIANNQVIGFQSLQGQQFKFNIFIRWKSSNTCIKARSTILCMVAKPVPKYLAALHELRLSTGFRQVAIIKTRKD